jgi:T5SS/PEP-CTERM-associated repeat protein
MKRRLSASARMLRTAVATVCVVSALSCACTTRASEWNTDNSGLFSDPLNWDGGVPGINDEAFFDRGNASLTVSFNSEAAFGFLTQRSGTVTLQSIGGPFGVTASDGISVASGGATSAVLKTFLPTLNTDFVNVGNGNGSNGTLDVLAGTLNVNGGIGVGFSNATGTVNIQNGAIVNNDGGTVLGRQNGNGFLNVVGPGSTLNNIGPLIVGEQGSSAMSILQGAAVSNAEGEIRQGSVVTIDGLGSRWINITDVDVHFDGSLSLTNHGRIDAGFVLENSGTVSGDGEIHTELFRNWNVLRLTPSATGLSVHGDFDTLGFVNVEIASATQHGRLNVTGSAYMRETLQLSLVNNFVPQSGDSFDIFDADFSNGFSSLDFPQLSGGLKWDVSQLNANGVVSVGTAAADTWKVGTHGNWSDGSKWLDGSTPTSADSVHLAVTSQLGNSHTIDFSAAPTAIKDFAMSAGRTKFRSTSGANSLNINAAGGGQNVTISGSGTELTLGDGPATELNLNVGNNLIVQDGGVLLADSISESDISVGGNVMIDGGGFAAMGEYFHLGNAKTFAVQNGGWVNLPGFVTPSNTVIDVNGVNSSWTGAISIVKGSQMSVMAGGFLGFASQINVGTDGSGTLIVDGNSSVESANIATIGSGGAGAFTLSNGADASIESVNIANGSAGSTGGVSVLTGATLQTSAIQAATEIGGQGNATIEIQGANSVIRVSNATLGNSATGSAVVNVGTTASGARLESISGAGHSTVIQKTATVNIGSSSTQGEFLAGSDVHIDGGLLKVASGSSFQLGVGKQLTVQNGGRAEISGSYATGQNGVFNLAGATAELQVSGLFRVQNGSKVNLLDGNSLATPAGLVVASGGQVNLPAGTLLDVSGGSTTLSPQGSINITGGSANLGILNAAGGTIQLTSGAVTFLGNLSTGENQPFGPNPTIATNQYLTLHDTTTVNSLNVLTLAGGSLTTGSLINNGAFAFNAGTLRITGTQGLTIGAGGPLGSTFTLGAGRTLNPVVQTEILSAAYFAIDGGASFTTVALNNAGETNLTSSAVTLNAATVNNSGLLRGDGRIIATMNNLASGEIRAESGKTLKFIGSGTNAGRVNLQGGTVEFSQPVTNAGTITGHGTIFTGGAGLTNSGQINLSGGYTEVFGNVQNQAASPGGIRVLANTDVVYWDNVTHNAGSVFNVSAGATATFAGDFQGMGISGPGSVEFQGNVSPGFSPAAMFMGGDVSLAASSVLKIEIGGSTQSHYDYLQAAGSLYVGGTLQVSLIDGFVPAAGNRFYLLISPDISGLFTTIELPDLPPSLAWNTFNLYSDGYGYIETWGVSPPAGDFDSDYDVDGADFVAWQTHFPMESGATLADGDADSDGDVDGADFVLWQTNFSPPASAAAASVPEPTGFFAGLAGTVAICFIGFGRTRFKVGFPVKRPLRWATSPTPD